jgi:hypothetical protein
MARIFTTRFYFNQQVYDAIITIYSRDGRPNFNIQLMDGELHDLIPGGKLECQGEEGLTSLHDGHDQLSVNLIRSVAAAIKEHINP